MRSVTPVAHRDSTAPMPTKPTGKTEAMILWGIHLRRARKALGLTQRELQETIGGMEAGTVSAWENGRSPPDQYFLMRLAQLYGIDPGYILLGRLDRLDPEIRRKLQTNDGQ